MSSLFVVFIVASSIWVGADASQRDWSHGGLAKSPAGWIVGSLLLWIVVFPVYLAQRSYAPKKQHGPGNGSTPPQTRSDEHLLSATSIPPPTMSVPPPSRTAGGNPLDRP
jgi:hypothetical protein